MSLSLRKMIDNSRLGDSDSHPTKRTHRNIEEYFASIHGETSCEKVLLLNKLFPIVIFM